MRPSLAVALAVAATLSVFLLPADGIGSTSTLAIAHGSSSTVCGVLAGVSPRSIQCARADATGALSFPLFPNVSFASVSGGHGSLCGLRADGTAFFCWDAATLTQKRVYNDSTALEELAVGDVQIAGVDRNRTFVHWWRADSAFPDKITGSYRSLTSGRGFTCAISTNGSVSCWGPRSGEIPVAFVNSNMSTIVAGDSHACGVSTAGRVICGGNNDAGQSTPPSDPAFEFGNLALGSSHTCAVRRYNGTVVCWGAGAGGEYTPANTTAFVFIVAGGNLTCGLTVVNFTVLCWGTNRSDAAVPALPPTTSPSGSRSRTFWRQGSRVMRRQRSGPSSFKDRAEEFSFSELATATKNFSLETKIGAGSFGTVYKGKLPDGREVAIKRSESGPRTKKFQEKESAFQSELAFLSRLHHKHLVGLVGYCEEREERLLVYEYMKNGALYDHLHPKNGDQASVLNSWKMRIKVLLDAARGIEYLHSYAVPPIIHRDIKSSNILLDGNWIARVSDFGLSLMGPESGSGHLSMKAAGTVGYMDPEYYGLHHLTVKSDVYGLGVVMLEVLTGRRAIFKDEEGGNPTSVVDYAVPCIVAGDVGKVLDARVGQPGPQEAEAVELVAYTAVHCVHLEGKNRPNMTDIVANLESALALCEGSHGSISSASAD
ncbi:hypothetical protein GW17_00007782 [Ensete ventricosum]|uniref:Uncharacterized protein n=1 Tax=Ensete ventricosum TaxID=4639 RepID=A0A444FYS2_ENSVE|nr:hypothetical protein GW17_00007782 [Ensete ventricosum]RZR72778.1 hypothetical protein BHM03_00016940 [Ensete ventricosum]